MPSGQRHSIFDARGKCILLQLRKELYNNSLSNIMTPISVTINYNPPTDKEQVDFLSKRDYKYTSYLVTYHTI